MATVDAVALTDFQHDNLRAREGKGLSVEAYLAADLERQGLIRIRVAPLRGRRILGVDPGKVQAAGEVAPSSSSQAAPPSPSTTSPSFAPGATTMQSKRAR